MVGPQFLLAASLIMGLVPAISHMSECSSSAAKAGTCSVNPGMTDSGVDVTGEENSPGASGSGGGDSSWTGDGGGGGGGTTTPTEYPEPRLRTAGPIAPIIIPRITPAPDTPADPVDPTPVITLRDLASFNPAPPTAAMEPNGWAVIGLDANFVASAAAQTIGGTLLGRPAQVFFTPVGFSWDYGDSSGRRSSSGGATWAALHLPEFSPTSTSHVYRAKGTFSVLATAYYTAAFRFDGGAWQSVAGTLPLSAPRMSVTAVDGKTVLVRRDCSQSPLGPGC